MYIHVWGGRLGNCGPMYVYVGRYCAPSPHPTPASHPNNPALVYIFCHRPRSSCLVESQPQPAHSSTLTSLKLTVPPGLYPCGCSTARRWYCTHPPSVQPLHAPRQRSNTSTAHTRASPRTVSYAASPPQSLSLCLCFTLSRRYTPLSSTLSHPLADSPHTPLMSLTRDTVSWWWNGTLSLDRDMIWPPPALILVPRLLKTVSEKLCRGTGKPRPSLTFTPHPLPPHTRPLALL